VHPLQTEEDVLAAKLLAAFREFKRHQVANLQELYADKLHALNQSFLATWQSDTGQQDAAKAQTEDELAHKATLATLWAQITEVSSYVQSVN
jgi:coiled-coil and C2 domain-containing protein 2A